MLQLGMDDLCHVLCCLLPAITLKNRHSTPAMNSFCPRWRAEVVCGGEFSAGMVCGGELSAWVVCGGEFSAGVVCGGEFSAWVVYGGEFSAGVVCGGMVLGWCVEVSVVNLSMVAMNLSWTACTTAG